MSSQLPTQIQLGDFAFDTAQRQLLRADVVIVLEPKVYDLLCYLLLNSQRFVSLAELHQQVWAGRVVTDTAVRRTISKLRVALGDTDSENPRYLKTQMKLGYQLVCENSALSDVALPALPEQARVAAKSTAVRNVTAALLFLLAVLTGAYLLLIRSTPTLLVTPIASSPGEKLALNVSPDGRYLSYNAQSLHDKQWRPFLYDSSNGMLNALQFDMDYSNSFSVVSFDTDGSLIATHNSLQKQGVSLEFYGLTDSSTPTESIHSDKFEKLLFVHPLEDGRYLLNAQKINSSSVHYYVFEKSTKQFNQLTFSNLDEVDDVDARVSPDGIYAVVLRHQRRPDLKLSLQLYRLSDSAFIAEWPLPGKHSDVAYMGFAWLNNQQVLLSKDSNIFRIDIKSKEIEQLAAQGRFGFIQRDAQGQLYAIQYGERRTEATKSRWSTANEILQRYDFAQPILRQDFAETDSWHWQLVQQDNVYSLHRFEPQSGTREVAIADTEGYWLEAQNTQADLLILRSRFHLRLFDRNSNTWRDLSQPTQHVSYATFSPDNRYIWFNERVGSEWFINQFDLSSKKQQRLVAGYFQLYQWQQYYIGITEQGDIWLLDQQWSRVRQVPIQFITDHRHHIALRGDNLLVAHLLQGGHWQFERFNLVSGETQKKLDESLPVQTILSIDSTGTKMLVSSRFAASHDLVKITLH